MPTWHIIWYHRLYHRVKSRILHIGYITGCIGMHVTWISLLRGHGDLSYHFGHIISPYRGIHIQLADGTRYRFILYTGFLVYMHFLSTGMRVWPISWARDIRSLWDFRRWIPGEKSHMIDYLLGLFGIVGPEVIFIVGFMWHVDNTWHVELAWWHTGHDFA